MQSLIAFRLRTTYFFVCSFFSLFMFIAQAYSQESFSYPDRSYGENAQEIIWPEIIDLSSLLEDFSHETLPHESKYLRKKVGYLRFYLDLFAFSYASSEGEDLWLDFRKLLDRGYSLLGNYKDLFDILAIPKEKASKDSYKKETLKRMNNEILLWKALFEAKISNKILK